MIAQAFRSAHLRGRKGWITDHLKSGKSKRAMPVSCSFAKVNRRTASLEIAVMGQRPGPSGFAFDFAANTSHTGPNIRVVRMAETWKNYL